MPDDIQDGTLTVDVFGSDPGAFDDSYLGGYNLIGPGGGPLASTSTGGLQGDFAGPVDPGVPVEDPIDPFHLTVDVTSSAPEPIPMDLPGFYSPPGLYLP